jgi:chromosome segregation ATPase
MEFDFNNIKANPENFEELRQKATELNSDFPAYKAGLKIEFDEYLRKNSMMQTITENTNQIEKHVSSIDNEIIELHQQIEKLTQDLQKEHERAEQAEKKAKIQAQWFSVIIAVFSVTLTNGLPRLINWIQSLLQ